MKQLQQNNKNVSKINALLRTTGVALSMIVLVFVINGVINAGQTVSQAQSATSKEPGIMQFLAKDEATFQSSPVLLAANTATNIVTPSDDLNQIVGSIHNMNDEILSSMKACIALRNDAQSDISNMRDKEQDLKEQIADVNEEMRDIDNTDPDRKEKRKDLNDKRSDLYAERNQLLRDLSERKRDYNNDKRDCQRSLTQKQTDKRKLESQLQNAYNKSSRLTVN